MTNVSTGSTLGVAPLIYLNNTNANLVFNISILNCQISNISTNDNVSVINMSTDSTKSLNITNSTFTNIKMGVGSRGGVLYINSTVQFVYIGKSRFENVAVGLSGGAIYFGVSSVVNMSSTGIYDCTFKNCTASEGGM
jgi:hypothetical protein